MGEAAGRGRDFGGPLYLSRDSSPHKPKKEHQTTHSWLLMNFTSLARPWGEVWKAL